MSEAQRASDGAQPKDEQPFLERRHPPAKRRRRPRTWTQRGKAFLRKYRQPVIGLSLAGAAGPLAKASSQETQPEPQAKGPVNAAPSQASLQSTDQAAMDEATAEAIAADPQLALEEQVGQKWAEAKAEATADQARADTIHSAVQRYAIDERLASDIYDTAQKAGIDTGIAFGLVKTESNFRHRAVSHVGARGLTQVMPRTARWLRPGTNAEDLFDRKVNLELGFHYLKDLIDKYDGNVKLALLAYNRGPGTVDKILRRGGNPDNGYASKVMRG